MEVTNPKQPPYAIWSKKDGGYWTRDLNKCWMFREKRYARRELTIHISGQRAGGTWGKDPNWDGTGYQRNIWTPDPNWTPRTRDDYEIHEVEIKKIKDVTND